MLAGKLQAGRLATCWAESTCWTAFSTAARKAGDVVETTDVRVDGAVEAMLDADDAVTDGGGIPSDSSTRDNASNAADWLLRVFPVFISDARIRKDLQIERNRSAKISKQHCKRKGNATQKPCKSPKGPPAGHVLCREKTADCISLSLTLPKLYLATFRLITNTCR